MSDPTSAPDQPRDDGSEPGPGAAGGVGGAGSPASSPEPSPASSPVSQQDTDVFEGVSAASASVPAPPPGAPAAAPAPAPPPPAGNVQYEAQYAPAPPPQQGADVFGQVSAASASVPAPPPGAPAAAPAPAPPPQVQYVPAPAPSPAALARQATFAALVRQPGLVSFALTQAVVLGGALVSALLLSSATSLAGDSGNGVSVPTTLSTLLVLMGALLGGHLSITVSFYLQVTVTVTLLSLGTLLAVGTGVYLVARRRSAVDGSVVHTGAALLRIAVEALATGLVAGLLTGVPEASTQVERASASASASFPLVVLMVTVVVLVALSAARVGDQLMAGLPAALRQALRELWSVLVSLGVVGAVVLVVGGTVWAATEDVLDVVPAGVVYLPNLVVLFLVLGTFGGIALDGAVLGADIELQQGSSSTTLGDLPVGVAAVAVLVVLLAAVVAAARVGVLRPRSRGAVLARTWPVAAGAAAVSLPLLYLLVPLRLSGEGGDLGSGTVVPTGWSFVTLSLLVYAISVLAEYLPAWAYANAHSLFVTVVGRRAAAAWLTSQTEGDSASQGWVYGTDPATGAATATDLKTGSYFVEDTATHQWVQAERPASASPVVPAAPVPAAGAPPVLPEPAPMSAQARRRTRLGVAAVGLLLLVVVVGLAAVSLLNARRGPDQQVEAYLDLLAQGRAEQATQMVDPGVPNAQRELMTDEVLGAATARIEVVEVEEPQVSGDEATVPVTLSLDGERVRYTFTATKGDSRLGLLDTWEVSNALVVPVTLTSTDGLDALTVGGKEVALEREGDADSSYSSWQYPSSAEQYVYVGVYDVGLREGVSTYLTSDVSSVTVRPGASTSEEQSLEVSTKPTQELEDLVLEEVRAQTESCASVPGNTDEVCPTDVQDTDLDSLTVTQDASGIEELTASSFTSDQIIISVTRNPTQLNRNPEPRKVKFTFSGTIEWTEDGEQPRVVIDSSSASW